MGHSETGTASAYAFFVPTALWYWNQRLVDYTGLSDEERRSGGWEALHPGDVERVKGAWQSALPNGTQYEVEQRVRGRDGRYRRFGCRAVPVKNEHGQTVECSVKRAGRISPSGSACRSRTFWTPWGSARKPDTLSTSLSIPTGGIASIWPMPCIPKLFSPTA